MADMNVGFGKKSNVLLTGFKAGLKKESLKTEQEKSVFDAIDKDKNGVLDENEVQNFTKALDASNDGKVSRKEAKAFLKENNLDLKKKEVLNFLKANINNTENVESAKSVQKDGKTVVQVTYKDGSVETINPDKSSELATTDADGNVKTQYKDENGVLTRDRLEKKDGDKTVSTLETDYAQDGKTPTQSVEQDLENNSTTTILYKSGTPESKKVKQGTTTSNYSYNANGAYVLESKIENEGIPAKEKRTKYTYNENGTTTENIIEPGLKRETTRTISDDGIVEDIVDGNGTKTHNIKNKNDKKLTQTKTDANGKEYSIKYDGNGNTLGIVVQNGEKLEIIAKKFGVTVEDLKKANADVLNGKNEFSVGDEIKIPKEVEADDKNIQGRKSADEAKAEYKKEQEIKRRKAEQAALRRQQQAAQAAARRAQAAAREAQYKAMGLKNHKGQGKPIVGTYKGGKKEQFTIIGEAGYGRHLAKSKSGKVVTIAHDGVILKDSYVQATNLYGSGKKIKGKIKDKTGKLITKNYVEIPGAKLPHGRKAVVDEKGRTWVMSHDGFILDNNYVAKSNAADVIRTDSKTAQKAAIGMLESELNNAQKAFDAQMNKDGWAADVADGVSNIWGVFQKDGNQAWRVRRDLKTYRSQLNELKAAASKGDAQFRAKFKQIYGVDYNQNAIANYTMHPTEANFKKAFGTKNDIGTRVAKYNDSQDTGAAVVKTTATIAGGIAVGAVTGGAGLGALVATAVGTGAVSFAVDTSDRMSSKEGLKDGQLGEFAIDAALNAGSVFVGGVTGKVAGTVVKGATKTTALGKTVNVLSRTEKLERAAINVSGDVAYGAGQEYVKTGDVTLQGTLLNGATGIVGQGVTSGTFQRFGKKVKDGLENSGRKVKQETVNLVHKGKDKLHLGSGDNIKGSLPDAVAATPVQKPYVSETITTIRRPVETPAEELTTIARPTDTTTKPVQHGSENAASSSKSSESVVDTKFNKAMERVNNATTFQELEAANKTLTGIPLDKAQELQLHSKINKKKELLIQKARQGKSEAATNTDIQDAELKGHNKNIDFGETYIISDNATLKLSDSYSLDLRNSEIKTKLNNLKDGEFLVVGRGANADIKVPPEIKDVSNYHLLLEKVEGKIVVSDVSLNGSTLTSSMIRRLSAAKLMVAQGAINKIADDLKEEMEKEG